MLGNNQDSVPLQKFAIIAGACLAIIVGTGIIAGKSILFDVIGLGVNTEDNKLAIASEDGYTRSGDIQARSSEQARTEEEIIEVELNEEEQVSEAQPVVIEEQEEVAEEAPEVQEAPQEVVEENHYIPISEVKISVDMDLTQRTGLSREDFINYIAGLKVDSSGFFEENAGLIYDLCEKYELNEIFFCGLISAESGWNIAANHRRTYNYISLMSNGKLINYGSVENGLETAAKTLHNKYLTPGGSFYYGKTLAAMKTRFCPASSTWVSLVYGRMSQMLPK